jgi:hypothetical protein
MTADIVAHAGAHIFGYGGEICEHLLNRHRAKLGPALRDLVGVVDIGRVMTVMMDRHGLCIDMRFERVERITERRQLERPGGRGLRDSPADAERQQCGNTGDAFEIFTSVHDFLPAGVRRTHGPASAAPLLTTTIVPRSL